jgi:type II secretory pathway pseudopilin PulG
MELLVVISIITLLISIMSPSLGQAKENGRQIECRTKLRSIMQAFQMFADDRGGTLPAAYYEGPELWQKSWGGTEVGAQGSTGAFKGSLVQYIGGLVNLPAAYRCPSLPTTPWGSGTGSNGRFDYSSFASLSGAKHSLIGNTSTWQDPGTGVVTTAPCTPIIVEEDPLLHINGCCIETGHGSSDQQGVWHFGNSNFAATDGSAHMQKFSGRGANCFEWTTRSPKGVWTSLSETGGWASWNAR